jgi:hypothetical protein
MAASISCGHAAYGVRLSALEIKSELQRVRVQERKGELCQRAKESRWKWNSGRRRKSVDGVFGGARSGESELPPMFLAWAQDDAVALEPIVKFHAALTSAGHRPEVHIFSAGGQGFGMRQQGTSSDHWIEEFYYWLQAQRLTDEYRAGRDRR